MLKPKTHALPLVLAIAVSGCSYIQGFFPDKERDYQYTTEIPPLNLPSDIQSQAIAKAVATPTTQDLETFESSRAPIDPVEKQQPAAENNANSAPKDEIASNGEELSEPDKNVAANSSEKRPEAEPEQSKEEGPVSVEIVRYADGERRLRLSSSPERAWHLVSKALSRNSIEVTERDQRQKLFLIQYTSETRNTDDGSLLDEAVFLFQGFESNEKEYLLKLLPVDGGSDLAVVDKDYNPVTDEASVKLLRLLGGTIQGN